MIPSGVVTDDQRKFIEEMHMYLNVSEEIKKSLNVKKLKKPSKYNPDGSYTDEYKEWLIATNGDLK